jgi:hypothetical protein
VLRSLILVPDDEESERQDHALEDGDGAALIDFDLAMPTTRLYDIANALWYWAPFKWGDPRDRAPALAAVDIPHRVAVFADAYGMTPQQRAELAPLAVDMARRYHRDSRASAELDPVFRKQWEEGGKDVLPRAEAWVRDMPGDRRPPQPGGLAAGETAGSPSAGAQITLFMRQSRGAHGGSSGAVILGTGWVPLCWRVPA